MRWSCPLLYAGRSRPSALTSTLTFLQRRDDRCEQVYNTNEIELESKMSATATANGSGESPFCDEDPLMRGSGAWCWRGTKGGRKPRQSEAGEAEGAEERVARAGTTTNTAPRGSDPRREEIEPKSDTRKETGGGNGGRSMAQESG